MIGSKSSADSAADNNVDHRIIASLEALSLDYDVDSDNDVQVMLPLHGDRYQQVVLASQTHVVGQLEIRKIYSVGYKSAESLSAKLANLLLGINHSSALGAWQLLQSGGEYFAAYSAQVAAETDSDTLLTVIRAVAESADSIEAYLTGQDVF